jgi:hypothetical protein
MSEEREERARPAQSPTLGEAIERLADEMDGIHRHDAGTVVEFLRGANVFAVREGPRVSFRLRPEVIAAALRTPDTGISVRGSEWITLQPRVVDGFALDRALSWFESAWRFAGESPDTTPRALPN